MRSRSLRRRIATRREDKVFGGDETKVLQVKDLFAGSSVFHGVLGGRQGGVLKASALRRLEDEESYFETIARPTRVENAGRVSMPRVK